MQARIGALRERVRLAFAGLLLVAIWSGAAAVGALWLIHTPARLTTAADYAVALARLSGLLAGYAVIVLVALMSRVPMIERTVGSARLVRWHALGGRYTVLAVVVHVGTVVWGYAQSSRIPVRRQIVVLMRSYPGVLLAVVAATVLVGVGVSSARAVRRSLSYEAWYHVHLLTYAAVALGFSHQLANGTDFVYDPPARLAWTAMYVAVGGTLAYYRLVMPMANALRRRLVVSSVVDETGGAISISVQGRGLTALGAEAGQFFRLRFLSRGRWWQSHPFSLSAEPTPQTLRFTVKPVGSHTRELRHVAPGTPVLAAGPFGTLTASRRQQRKVLLIGAGIGITPLRALFESMPVEPGELTLIYRSRTEADLSFRAEIDTLARQRGAAVTYLVGPRTDAALRLDSRSLPALVPDLATHDVFLCAPAAMTAELATALRTAGVPARNIHHESFELAPLAPRRTRQAVAVSMAAAGFTVIVAFRNDFASISNSPSTAKYVSPGRTAPAGEPASARHPTSADVVVVGSLQRTLYTNVQVEAVLRHGRLVDVRALQLPNLDARSRQISAMAAPILRREAIVAGSADIDMVSGATYTSAAYARSLQAALDSRPAH